MINLNKKILITWASWFVWSNLVRKFIEKWYKQIYIIIRKWSDLWRLENIKEKIIISTVSLTNFDEINNYINELKPNIIFHLAAAWANIWRDWKWVNDLFNTNILWTINLINSCKKVWFDYFINTGSTSEYWQKDFPMKENDILEPNNEYWITKSAATQYSSFIWKTYNLPIYTFRLFSVYWSYEDKKRLIPTLINNYLNWESPKLSTPESVRDYIFIDDIIEYYLNIDKIKWDFWWIYNIWNWIQYKISEIVEIIKKISNSNINPQYWKESIKQNEPKVWVSDNSKALEVFWINNHSIKDWLEKTYDWFRNNLEFYK